MFQTSSKPIRVDFRHPLQPNNSNQMVSGRFCPVAAWLLIALCFFNGILPWAQSLAKSTVPLGANQRRLERCQRHKGRLQGLLKRIVRPRLEFVESNGTRFWLPLRAKDAEIEECSEDELDYLSGFFDGDGCVTLRKDGRIRLQISQSVKGVDTLLRFRRAFGGCICRTTDGCGFRTPVLQWEVGGDAAGRAGLLLAKRSLTKQTQLCVALHGNVAKEKVQSVRRQLTAFKATEDMPQKISLSWPYFAGFFDAEGCVGLRAHSSEIRLQLTQRKPSILQMLETFLKERGLSKWTVYQAPQKKATVKGKKGPSYFPYFSLACSDTACSRQTLEQLVASGLNFKQDQAQIALQLNSSNRADLRAKLLQLVGQQNRYRRLDSDGTERARLIDRLRSRIRNCRNETEQKLLKEELKQLQEDHKLRNLRYTCNLMSSDIRRMLNEGSYLKHLKPLNSKSQKGARAHVKLKKLFTHSSKDPLLLHGAVGGTRGRFGRCGWACWRQALDPSNMVSYVRPVWIFSCSTWNKHDSCYLRTVAEFLHLDIWMCCRL